MSGDAVKKTRKGVRGGALGAAGSEADKLMMWSEDGVPHRECVAGGFTETLNEQGVSVPRELGTRVNRPAPKAAPAKVQTVQFFPNPKLKKPAE